MPNSFDYLAPLDSPDVAQLVFHPRPDPGYPLPEKAFDRMIDSGDGVGIGLRVHPVEEDGITILFFHGNGEIAADYDDVGPVYNRYGMNFFVAEYRGYGKSGGVPSGRSMLGDAHTVFDYVKDWLKENGRTAPLVVMGRSLGSASALELAASRSDEIRALILESGFAETMPLLRLLGIDPDRLKVGEKNGFRNRDKIREYTGPTLILHAQYDSLIPLAQAELLMEASGAHNRQLVVVPGADHNDILMKAGEEYFRTIHRFLARLRRPSK